jgi:hypothetical protein
VRHLAVAGSTDEMSAKPNDGAVISGAVDAAECHQQRWHVPVVLSDRV